jgi:hypothetical protein
MTKIAYSLLVHKNPEQVSRLIANIYSSTDFFQVNIFGKNLTEETWNNKLAKFKGSNFLITFRHEKAWGTFPVVDATIDSMKQFNNLDYNYFINLTGQCYPLKSVNSIKQFLDNKNFAYLEAFKIPGSAPKGWGKRGGLDRIENSYYRNPLFVGYTLLSNRLSRSTKKEVRRFIKLPRVNKRLPYNLEPYGGSAYFCLSKKHIDFILEYLKNKMDLLDFFRRTFAPDELFFQTIIMNSVLKDTVVDDNLRYIDWIKKGVPLPAILTIEDKDDLLTSPKLFARKFDIEMDEEILDIIDHYGRK